MGSNTIDISYKKTLTSITFTSLPHVVFTIDDVTYTTGSDGTYISTLYLEIRELLRLSCMGMVIPFLKSLMFHWSVI